jgi:predicted Rdx family selenoprotein
LHYVHIEIIEGSGGIFKVLVDEETVYDKAVTSRFPHANEVVNNIKERFI